MESGRSAETIVFFMIRPTRVNLRFHKNKMSPDFPIPWKPRPTLRIAGKRIGRGKIYDLSLEWSESYTGTREGVPVRVIAGPKPGPVVFLTGGIHGDELNGLGIIRELVFEQPPILVRGTLIAVPAVNVPGLERHSRYLSDRRDLNRCFPGTAHGSLSSRLAHTVFEQLIRHCDCGLDFHTAAVRRTNYPNIRADLSDKATGALAEAFGCELVVHSKGAEGSLRRTAGRAGIPTIVLEAGEVWKIEPGIVDLGLRGARQVLAWLGMLDGVLSTPGPIEPIRRTRWIRAERGGILKFHVVPGQPVRRGQILATNLDIFGRHQHQVTAPADGVILGMTTMPAVKPGEPLFHLAIPTGKTARRIREVGPSLGANPEAARLRRILATNVRLAKTRVRRTAP